MHGGGAARGLGPEGARDDDELPLEQLPPMPARGVAYWVQTASGLGIGGSLMAAYNIAIDFAVAHADEGSSLSWWSAFVLAPLTRAASIVAACCTLRLLAGRSGVVPRSKATCRPMPAEVKRLLRAGEGLRGMSNVTGEGPDGWGSYCVRCLVWRRASAQEPGAPRSHHCSVCQRCVEGFDHHCRLLGRCVVRGNMIFLRTVITLMMAGMVNVFLAGFTAVPEELLMSGTLHAVFCCLLAVYVCCVSCVTTCMFAFAEP
ncbi:unnamed protein product [Prorocentrum cordatum]|uniref:Palmitoyltransferase n=2 Tax=Prorocentrum cordatum TaxID=2364126 RepID=A0ABN9TTJ5_9DINO|nr:unnamed protein product [Polarella glacialis]